MNDTQTQQSNDDGIAPTEEPPVWAPPPTEAPPVGIIPFKNTRRSVRGFVSEFRVGTLSVHSNGVTLSATAVLPFWPRYWILVAVVFIPLAFDSPASLAVAALAWLIAYILLEEISTGKDITLPWSNIEEVVYAPGKSQAYLVYHREDGNHRPRTYSLGTNVEPLDYDELCKAVDLHAPATVSRATPNKLKFRRFATPGKYSFATSWLLVMGYFYLYNSLH